MRVIPRPKTYQVPKATHPWRQYETFYDKDAKKKIAKKDRGRKRVEEEDDDKKPVREFLGDLVESWETLEIYTYAYGRRSVFKVRSLPQYKVAAWLAGMLKRNYGKRQDPLRG